MIAAKPSIGLLVPHSLARPNSSKFLASCVWSSSSSTRRRVSSVLSPKRSDEEQRSREPAMDRVQLVLLGLPILLFCSDVVTLFAPLPPAAPEPDKAPHAFQPGDPSAADASAHVEPQVDGPGSGTTVDLKYCASCSYRGTAMTMKRMLESSFPGIHVVLENYPPPFPKRALSKAVPLLQFGAMATLMAGDQIFPRFGMVPPPWYYSLRANRFGTMASIWLFGNFAHSFLQSSGAFEVYCNGQLVFSKLSEQRFPSELELQELIGSRIPDPLIGSRIPDPQIVETLEKVLVLDDADADADDAMRD